MNTVYKVEKLLSFADLLREADFNIAPEESSKINMKVRNDCVKFIKNLIY